MPRSRHECSQPRLNRTCVPHPTSSCSNAQMKTMAREKAAFARAASGDPAYRTAVREHQSTAVIFSECHLAQPGRSYPCVARAGVLPPHAGYDVQLPALCARHATSIWQASDPRRGPTRPVYTNSNAEGQLWRGGRGCCREGGNDCSTEGESGGEGLREPGAAQPEQAFLILRPVSATVHTDSASQHKNNDCLAWCR